MRRRWEAQRTCTLLPRAAAPCLQRRTRCVRHTRVYPRASIRARTHIHTHHVPALTRGTSIAGYPAQSCPHSGGPGGGGTCEHAPSVHPVCVQHSTRTRTTLRSLKGGRQLGQVAQPCTRSAQPAQAGHCCTSTVHRQHVRPRTCPGGSATGPLSPPTAQSARPAARHSTDVCSSCRTRPVHMLICIMHGRAAAARACPHTSQRTSTRTACGSSFLVSAKTATGYHCRVQL